MNFEQDEKEIREFFKLVEKNISKILLNPRAFSELIDLIMILVGICAGFSKFQFPRDLWSGKFKDPFKVFREKSREFKTKWLR